MPIHSFLVACSPAVESSIDARFRRFGEAGIRPHTAVIGWHLKHEKSEGFLKIFPLRLADGEPSAARYILSCFWRIFLCDSLVYSGALVSQQVFC